MKNKKQLKILWLDDLRDPFLNIECKVPKETGKVIWVKNYGEFVTYIEREGLPDIISFDHDLSFEHYTPQQYWNDYDKSKEWQESQKYTEKTGKDCANWLIEYCMNNASPLPVCYVHSANPVGADNIRSILNNFKNRR